MQRGYLPPERLVLVDKLAIEEMRISTAVNQKSGFAAIVHS